MDYSSSIHDADNPAGASPWGSSPVASPQHARTSSFPTPSEVPPSPMPYSSSNSGQIGFSQDDTMSGGSYQRPESNAGTESVTESDGRRPDTADSVRSQPEQQQSFLGQQQQAPLQQQYQQQPHRTEPARYHPAARQSHHPQQYPQAPQYKLQAKITGLERTGRKDPILRFDVHVCIGVSLILPVLLMQSSLADVPDQPPQVSNNTIPRCASNTF